MEWLLKRLSLIFLFISSLILFSGCKPAYSPPLVERGVLDLRSWDFQTMGSLRLQGNCSFYWKPEDFTTTAHPILPAEPTAYLHVPGTWNHIEVEGHPIGGEGWAYYGLTILFPKDFTGHLGLRTLGMGTAGTIYINGIEGISYGSPGQSFAQSRPSFQPQVIHFDVEGERLDLLVKISNFHHWQGGIWNPIFLGEAKEVSLMRHRAIFGESLLSGVGMIMGLYLFLLYLFNREIKALLVLCLFCFIIFLRFLFTGEGLINLIIPGIPWLVFLWISDIGVYLALPLLIRHICYQFPHETNITFYRAVFAISLVFSALTLILPSSQGSFLQLLFQIVLVVGSVIALLHIIKALRAGRKGAGVFLIGFSLLVVTAVNDILYSRHILFTAYLLPWGILAFLFSQTILLSLLSRDIYHAKTHAESATRAKSEFLANMSHEIRTPLNAIIGMNHLLKHTSLTEKQMDYLDKSHWAARNLLNLINDILDFSKVEAGKVELEYREIPMESHFQDLVGLLEQQAEEKGIDLTFQISPEIPEFLMGDPLRIDQVLINLINNAIKFTQRGGVAVSLSREEDQETGILIAITVKDSGIGMTVEQQDRIFESFNQGEKTIARNYGGTGLGLSISKELVLLMGGSIELESTPGYGSTFTVYLPMEYPPKNSGESKSSVDEDGFPNALKRIRGAVVLLVEDNPVNRQIAREIMELKGISVREAYSGEEALEQMEDYSIDLVLTDIQMDGMDGFELSERIRAQGKYGNLPILAMTAHASKTVKDRCIKSGMNDFLSKPIDPKKLFSALIRWIPAREKDGAPGEPEEGTRAVNRDMDAFRQIPQIDVDEVLTRIMGNQNLFFSLYDLFVKEYNRTADLILSLDKDEAYGEIRDLAHSLKGAGSNIGAKRLCRLAIKVEEAIDGDHGESLEEYIRIFCEELDSLIESLKRVVSPEYWL